MMTFRQFISENRAKDEERLKLWCHLYGEKLTKQKILTQILKDYKVFIGDERMKNYVVMLKDTIALARKLGYDYPEFKTIEKHIEAHTS